MPQVNLGRVSVVFEGIHDGTLPYGRLSIVKENLTGKYYSSIAAVPANALLADARYWKIFLDTSLISFVSGNFEAPSMSIGGVNIELKIARPTKISPTSITVADTLLTLSSPIAGTDYYFSKTAIQTVKDANTIGGFHYGLTPTAEAPTGNKTEADMVQIRGINAYSIWTKWFRPVANPGGMVFIGSKWYDIYLLNSEHIINGTSKAGATIAAGATTYGRAIPKIPLAYGGNGTTTYGKLTWFQLCEIAKSHGKELIPYAEFPTIAYGVNEGKSSAIDLYEVVVGKVEHYSNLTSKYGIEQAAGVQWVWGKDVFSDTSGTYNWLDNADQRGQIYSVGLNPKAVMLGGNSDDGVIAGSRASNWNYYVWGSNWNGGARFACDNIELVQRTEVSG